MIDNGTREGDIETVRLFITLSGVHPVTAAATQRAVKSLERIVEPRVVRLTKSGVARVLNGHEGMTFIVNRYTGGDGQVHPTSGRRLQRVAHVRDYRYPGDHFPWQIWSLGEEDYEVIT